MFEIKVAALDVEFPVARALGLHVVGAVVGVGHLNGMAGKEVEAVVCFKFVAPLVGICFGEVGLPLEFLWRDPVKGSGHASDGGWSEGHHSVVGLGVLACQCAQAGALARISVAAPCVQRC